MAMEPSILNAVKKMLGLAADYTAFDEDVLIAINSALSSLNQLGVGPTDGIVVEDTENLWADLGLTDLSLPLAKTYIYLKARMLFDPPATSFLIEAYNTQLAEQEWRLCTIHDATAEETYADLEVESEV